MVGEVKLWHGVEVNAVLAAGYDFRRLIHWLDLILRGSAPKPAGAVLPIPQ
jgi:hypothetical protein